MLDSATWRTRRLLDRLGVLFTLVCATALLAAATMAASALSVRWKTESHAAQARASVSPTSRSGDATNPDSTGVSIEASAVDLPALLNQAALGRKVDVLQVSYSESSRATAALAVREASFTLSGPYRDVRGFLSALHGASPQVSIERLELQRIDDGRSVEVRGVLVAVADGGK
jgi:hypothetical protein